MGIQKVRQTIDRIDLEILRLLNLRAKKALEIGRMKEASRKDIFAPHRERMILRNLLRKNRGPLPAEALQAVYKEILDAFRALQKKLRVVYLGPEATFTHQAALKSFGRTADYIAVKSISDVFDEVSKSRCDYGVVPIENSTEGVVNHTQDMFVDSDNKICSEILLEISHYLLSRARGLKDIHKIYSHPQAIAQSRNWIEDNLPNATLVETASTAQAAQAARREPRTAAIASEHASELYNLKILASRIEDRAANVTRFLVIGRNFSRPSGSDKTSILFSIKDKVGALRDMLVPFARHRLNLTKIESRPTKKRAWEYIFFMDFHGHFQEKRVRMALSELEKDCVFLKILGSYPVAE